ncbi:unnamed protein product [Spirodela intermedia]|uniref:Uncharacterized protein n=1 Tax=Spirodela intermedia TaxID=51605 RepID=A0A7I8JJ80_SPIIN|nr:unnamed protein product [Spirodela intermedia]CAA6670226.1 unnamed protein product [Spirodela intermedia]
MSECAVALPEDCWELVFRRLGDERLMDPVSLVCRRFLSITNRIRSDLTVSDRTVVVHGGGGPTQLFRRFPNLRRIAASDFHGNLDRLVQDMSRSGLKLEAVDLHGQRQCFPSLKALILGRFLHLENDDVLVIAESFPNLELLDISHPQRELDHSSELRQMVTDRAIEVLSLNLRNLKSIHLSGNHFLSDSALVSLSTNCPNLTEVVAHDCSFMRGEGIVFVLHHSPNLTSVSVNRIAVFLALRHLSLSRMLVPDELLVSLGDMDLQMRELSLSDCWGLSFTGLASVLQAYGRSLRRLVLIGLSFLSDGMMISVLPHLSNMNFINLSCCCDLSNTTFFSILRNCLCIEHIEMSKTTVGQGLLPAAPCLNQRLKSLRLTENPYLDDDTVGLIADHAIEEGMRNLGERCPEITELSIKGCTQIKSLGTSSGFLKLKTLKATGSGLHDKALSVLAQSCEGLSQLDLDGCPEVTEKGVKDVVMGCKRLQQLYLGPQSLDLNVLNWIVSSRLLLRKIVWQSGFLPLRLQDLFLSHGCVVRTRK